MAPPHWRHSRSCDHCLLKRQYHFRMPNDGEMPCVSTCMHLSTFLEDLKLPAAGHLFLPRILLNKMRFDYLFLAAFCSWPWTTLAAAVNDARCAFLPFGRPQASDCIYLINHIMPQGNDDPLGLVLWDDPGPHYISMPVFWFYSQSATSPRPAPGVIH